MFAKSSFLFVLLLIGVALAEIPSYIPVCGRRNPKLDECIINSIQQIQKKLTNGIPELDIPSVSPLALSNVVLADLPSFSAKAEMVKIYGLTKYTIDLLRTDLKKQQIDIGITFPSLKLDANYDVNAKILVPVVGKGPITIVTNNVKAFVKFLYKIIEKNGQKYMYFYSMTTKLKIEDFNATFESPEGVDKTFASAINTALVSSKKEILGSIVPNLERTISEQMLTISNNICKHFTYDELFPDRE